MALIQCPDCKREVSDKAASCPNCGSPMAKYCVNCGKRLELGVVCDCRQPVGQTFSDSDELSVKPGSAMIKVSGIIMIVLGAIGIFGGLGGLSENPSGPVLFEFALNVLVLTFGILAVCYCKKREKAAAVMGFGGTVVLLKLVYLGLCLSMLSDIAERAKNSADPTSNGYAAGLILGLIIGMIPPVLLIIGGNQLKNS